MRGSIERTPRRSFERLAHAEILKKKLSEGCNQVSYGKANYFTELVYQITDRCVNSKIISLLRLFKRQPIEPGPGYVVTGRRQSRSALPRNVSRPPRLLV